jgi:hypothetical protein
MVDKYTGIRARTIVAAIIKAMQAKNPHAINGAATTIPVDLNILKYKNEYLKLVLSL